MTEDKDARTKALLYLKEVIGNDAKFNKLNKGNPIDVTGSLGGKYILYPNGHVVRLDKDHPKLGKLHQSSDMPFPDVLATVYVWITKDEKRFLDNWGCGNISVTNPNANIPTEQVEPQVAREIVREEPEEERESWWDRHFGGEGFGMLLMLPVILVMMAMIVIIIPAVANFASSIQNSTVTVSPSPSTLINVISSSNSFPSWIYLPLIGIIILFVFMAVFVLFRRPETIW